MQMKKARNARMIFAFMVPLTVFAFWLGAFTNPSLINLESLDVYDSVSESSDLVLNDDKHFNHKPTWLMKSIIFVVSSDFNSKH